MSKKNTTPQKKNSDTKLLGQEIRIIREEQKKDIETMAAELDISAKELKEIEEGNYDKLNIGILSYIASYYNVTLEDLFKQ